MKLINASEESGLNLDSLIEIQGKILKVIATSHNANKGLLKITVEGGREITCPFDGQKYILPD